MEIHSKNDFLLVGERHLKYQIKLMSWSPKKDLLALASDFGDLLLHRLSSLEKVWLLAPLEKGCGINSLCWRPDGYVIAVSYNSKESGIIMVFAEKARIIWQLSEEKSVLRSPSICLKWLELETEENDSAFEDLVTLSSNDYLPDLPNLPSKDLLKTDIKTVIGSSKFHVLMACDGNNQVTLFAYGTFPLLSVSASSVGKVLDMHLSPDFKQLYSNISTSKENMTSSVQMVDISCVMENVQACKSLSQKACHIIFIMTYIENVLDLMNESCETVVQEMESKLTNYLINKNISGTIGDEFMHFLLWGVPSDVLKDLLMNHMTQKSVMKLGSLVEASYASIQQLLLVNFQLAADSLYYHLNEIKGMNTPTILNDFHLLDISQINQIISLAGSFILKATEMQQVISQSLKKFKAFFRWLYSSLLKVHGDAMDEIAQMSVKEMEFVADFVTESFIHEHEQLKISGREKHFNLDKVYQYLQTFPLNSPQNLDGNDWFRLVNSTPSLANNPLILKARPEASLRQLFLELRNQIKILLNCPKAITTTNQQVHQTHILRQHSGFVSDTNMWFHGVGQDSERSCFFLTSSSDLPCSEILLCPVAASSMFSSHLRIKFSCTSGDRESFCEISDFAYYNEKFFTVILKDGKYSLLVQVSLPSLVEEFKKNSDESSYICDASKFMVHKCNLDAMTAVKLAASGSRKVACVLGSDLRHIRAYEMDQSNDDDDDETDESMTM